MRPLRGIAGAATLTAACLLAGCARSPSLRPAPPSPVEAFDALLGRVGAAAPDDRPSMIDAFVASEGQTPLTDGERAVFYWRGEAGKVQLAGDMNGWDLSHAPELERVAGTDFWHAEIRAEPDARLDYKFVVDGKEWRLDPRNPRRISGGFGPNSELVMPAYRLPPEVAALADTGAERRGAVERHVLRSAALGEDREFFVYTPPGRRPDDELGSVYFHDGGDYLRFASADRLLDALVARGDLPPVVGVFVPPRRRGDEYVLNDAYVRFLADELVPWVRERYRTSADPRRTATVGASAGGLVAAYAALHRPDVFGLAACQSGAFSLGHDAVVARVLDGERAPVRFHLAVGTYETAVSGDPDEGNLLAAARRMRAALAARGYDVVLAEAHEGHSWGLWRARLGEALHRLFVEPGPPERSASCW